MHSINKLYLTGVIESEISSRLFQPGNRPFVTFVMQVIDGKSVGPLEVSAFDELAKRIPEFLSKGDEIMMESKLHPYKKNGNVMFGAIAKDIVPLRKRTTPASASQPQPKQVPPDASHTASDIPKDHLEPVNIDWPEEIAPDTAENNETRWPEYM